MPAARLGVLGGVVEQVREHLLQPGRRPPPRQSGSAGSVDLQRVPPRLDQRARDSTAARCAIGARSTALLAQLDLAAGDPRDVQQVVDQPGQVPHLALHQPRIRARSRRRRAAALHAAAPPLVIGGQRVAQLVGEHGQELVLAPVRGGQLLGAARSSSSSRRRSVTSAEHAHPAAHPPLRRPARRIRRGAEPSLAQAQLEAPRSPDGRVARPSRAARPPKLAEEARRGACRPRPPRAADWPRRRSWAGHHSGGVDQADPVARWRSKVACQSRRAARASARRAHPQSAPHRGEQLRGVRTAGSGSRPPRSPGPATCSRSDEAGGHVQHRQAAVAGSALIRRHTSKPLMSGSFTSRTIKVRTSPRASRSASAPVAASMTSIARLLQHAGDDVAGGARRR